MNFIIVTRSYSSYTCSTIKKSAKIIRNEFLDYFRTELGHTYVRSSPVMPINDYSVSFVNAGMNQFKGIFLNYYDPPATKVTNSQKCIRIGGKHNDLSLVGNDSYHHTFFEMLGNWSFGEYFKEEACRYAWDLLTKHYGIKEEFLYVTYFAGDEKLGLDPDLECKDIWLNIGVSKDKVLPFGFQSNFWEMAITGPCGPSTEIHIDRTKQTVNQSMRVNQGFEDLTELWNIVFIQYERLTNGTIAPLSKQHVDTGLGLERLVSILQEKDSNYDTDLFQPLFKAIQKYSKAPEYKGRFCNDTDGLDSGYRILADHSRMITVALADGMIPGENNKLRRIIRKTIDVGERIFKKDGILSEVSHTVTDNLGDVYPELQNNLRKVQNIIEFEQELFKKLRKSASKDWKKMVEVRPNLASVTDWFAPGLVNGYKYLQDTLKDIEASKILPGNIAFKLYDTHGLSVETITELAKIDSLYFDVADFQNELEKQRYRSRTGFVKISEKNIKECVEILEKNHVPKTDDSYKYICNENKYQFPTVESKITALIINGNLIFNDEPDSMKENTYSTDEKKTVFSNTKLNTEDEIGIVLDKTLFYSLEGGQTSDKGVICTKDLTIDINNVKKMNGYVIHFGKCMQNDSKNLNKILKVGDTCVASIDSKYRIGIMQHHTGAHLLNASLKQIMQIVYPRNSFILTNSLKLQFNSIGEKMSLDQLKRVEAHINNIIEADVPITIKVLNTWELLADDSISLIPGEIYPYTGIRVVEIDTNILKSKEACCGTHVPKTGVLEHFCLLSYSSKGATNLTIKAVVGPPATSVKLAGESMKCTILNLEQKLKTEKVPSETLKLIIEKMNEMNDEHKGTLLPYLVKQECLSKLEDLSKIARIQAKDIKKVSYMKGNT